MIKIKPTNFVPTVKSRVNKSVQSDLQNKLKKTLNVEVDLSGEEYGYYKVGGKVINIIFPR